MKVGCDHKEYPIHADGLPTETFAELVTNLIG